MFIVLFIGLYLKYMYKNNYDLIDQDRIVQQKPFILVYIIIVPFDNRSAI